MSAKVEVQDYKLLYLAQKRARIYFTCWLLTTPQAQKHLPGLSTYLRPVNCGAPPADHMGPIGQLWVRNRTCRTFFTKASPLLQLLWKATEKLKRALTEAQLRKVRVLKLLPAETRVGKSKHRSQSHAQGVPLAFVLATFHNTSSVAAVPQPSFLGGLNLVGTLRCPGALPARAAWLPSTVLLCITLCTSRPVWPHNQHCRSCFTSDCIQLRCLFCTRLPLPLRPEPSRVVHKPAAKTVCCLLVALRVSRRVLYGWGA